MNHINKPFQALRQLGNLARVDIMDNKTEQKNGVQRVKSERTIGAEQPIVTGILYGRYGWGSFYVLTPNLIQK